VDADEDVDRHDDREEKVRERHHRRGPEGNQQAQHHRVAHPPVEEYGLELDMRVGLAHQVQIDRSKVGFRPVADIRTSEMLAPNPTLMLRPKF